MQCLWYLGLAGCEEAHLAVLLGNTDLRVYRIRRDEALERHLFERAHRFWLEHVLTGTPPPPRTRDQVESLYPTHTAGLTREASPEMLTKLSRLAQLQEEVRLAEQELDEIRQEVALEMGPAEALTWGGQTLRPGGTRARALAWTRSGSGTSAQTSCRPTPARSARAVGCC